MEQKLIGRSDAHCRVLKLLENAAQKEAEILISGPSGVGKELYAQFVHRHSKRADHPFVPVNCGALPDSLLENELFGHGRGAFTGATGRGEGLVAAAEKGTLFLDEVDSLTPGAQVKLLRFLETKEYRRLGENSLKRADVRVLAATNRDLFKATEEGFFRQDMFFRLRVFPVDVPALCQRRDDIPPLLHYFIERYAAKYHCPPLILDAGSMRCLCTYSWPGNVRELKNCIHFLFCLELDRAVQVADLPLLDCGTAPPDPPPSLATRPLREAKQHLVSRFERDYITEALQQSNGNITQAARASGKPRRAFFELMRKYAIDANPMRAGG